MKAKLKRSILVVLLAYEGLPMPEGSLVEAVKLHVQPAEPTDDDVLDALKDCRAEGCVAGYTQDFTGTRTWSLTDKGTHLGRKLR